MVSEVLKQEYLEGKPVRKEDLIDKPLLVLDYRVMDSKFEGQYPAIQAKLRNRLITVLGCGFMLKQLRDIPKEKYPIRVRIDKKPTEDDPTKIYWRLVSW